MIGQNFDNQSFNDLPDIDDLSLPFKAAKINDETNNVII